ncbi:hypothetical protein C7M84_007910 [Penaeus vannamei]|uniref:Uncharacterized protein n=1 Tax=Penaeus vannamei TaxID=6689 RepID=A0A423TB55_PENVA|nr:hypothetical protein C7M84_007910 [Penaeus vannamei]
MQQGDKAGQVVPGVLPAGKTEGGECARCLRRAQAGRARTPSDEMLLKERAPPCQQSSTAAAVASSLATPHLHSFPSLSYPSFSPFFLLSTLVSLLFAFSFTPFSTSSLPVLFSFSPLFHSLHPRLSSFYSRFPSLRYLIHSILAFRPSTLVFLLSFTLSFLLSALLGSLFSICFSMGISFLPSFSPLSLSFPSQDASHSSPFPPLSSGHFTRIFLPSASFSTLLSRPFHPLHPGTPIAYLTSTPLPSLRSISFPPSFYSIFPSLSSLIPLPPPPPFLPSIASSTPSASFLSHPLSLPHFLPLHPGTPIPSPSLSFLSAFPCLSFHSTFPSLSFHSTPAHEQTKRKSRGDLEWISPSTGGPCASAKWSKMWSHPGWLD